MKKSSLVFLLLTIISTLSAHEFWLNPDKFIYKHGEKINIRFFVGENFEGENWKGNNEKIQSLKLYYGGVSDDISESLGEEKGDSVELNILDEGTHMIAFNSTNSYIEIDTSIFNNYLKDDGLYNAIEYRKTHNETDSIGRELYQRCAKTLIQIGNIKSKTFSVITGMPLDVIPVANPYSLKNSDSLSIKILFRNVPLTDALVKIWHREKGNTDKSEFLTNENGEIRFPVTTSGKWMASIVKMTRLPEEEKAQWQSYWGNLTWGYE